MTTRSQQTHNQSQGIRSFLEKVVISAGIGRLSQLPNFEEKALPQLMRDLALLAAQRPRVTRAKKSIAGFKIREGQIVGLAVTLRRKKMVDFFERFITIVLPRVKDFGGIDPRTVDERGALNVGIKEHVVFPEIAPEDSPLSFSLGVTIVPRVKHREAALLKYRELGVPLKESKK